MKKHLTKLIFLFLLGVFTSCSSQKTINLKLDYKIGEKKSYIIKETVFNYENVDYRFLNFSEKNIEFELKSINSDSIYNLHFSLITLKLIDSTQRKLEKYDSTKDESNMTLSEQNRHKFIKEEYGKKYKIAVDKNGKINKPFAELNGIKPRSDIFNFHSIQLIFPNDKVKLGEKWSYKKNGIFYPYQKSQITCAIKKINPKNIIIEFVSKVDFEDDRQSVIEKGEYILDRENHTINYAKVASKLDTGATGIFEIIVN